jgi:hypothetical protein
MQVLLEDAVDFEQILLGLKKRGFGVNKFVN